MLHTTIISSAERERERESKIIIIITYSPMIRRIVAGKLKAKIPVNYMPILMIKRHAYLLVVVGNYSERDLNRHQAHL